MEEKKKLRCPLGVHGGILATLIGITGIILNSVNFNLSGLLFSIALFLLGGPFVRVIMMVHSANDRLDEPEQKMEE
jgi:hypothetical protein